MKKLLLASTMLLGATSYSFSADLAEEVVVVDSAYDWSGVYFGGHAGYGWGDSVSSTPDLGFGGDYDSLDTNPDGFLLGATVGYNWQSGSFVVGVEGEIGYSWADDDVTFDDIRAITEYGIYGSLTGRLGFALDRLLLYGKGGAAFADIDNTAGDLDGGVFDPSDVTHTSGVRWGYTVGAGAEYAFTDQWSAKVEYMFADYGSETSGNDDGDTYHHDNEMHTVKLGLNYHF